MLNLPDFNEKQIVVVFASLGEKLSFKNDNLVVIDEDGNKKLQMSCFKIFSLYIVGHFTITTGLLQRAKKFDFSIYLFSYGLQPYGVWQAQAEGNYLLREKQYKFKSLNIAKRLISNKINNQAQALHHIRHNKQDIKEIMNLLTSYKNRTQDELTLTELLGIEGVASKIYFQRLFKNYHWQGRKPRTKIDITNVLLDIGYTQLFNFLTSMLNLYGFDLYKGVYHQPFYQRKSLVCDLVEPFRPIIDKAIYKAYRLKQINETDFTYTQNQYRIFGEKAKPYLQITMQAIINRKAEIFLYVQQYYRCFIREKNIQYYPWYELT